MRRADLTLKELLRTIRIHADEMVSYHGPAGLIQFRKHFKKYIQDVAPLEAALPKFMAADSLEKFETCLAESEAKLDLNEKVGQANIEIAEFEDCETAVM